MSRERTSSLNHTMPHRLTVASVAKRRSCTSNMMRTCSSKGGGRGEGRGGRGGGRGEGGGGRGEGGGGRGEGGGGRGEGGGGRGESGEENWFI